MPYRRLAATVILDAWMLIHSTSERQQERREAAVEWIAGDMEPWASYLDLRADQLREFLVQEIAFECIICGRPALRRTRSMGKSRGEGWLFCRTHLLQWQEGREYRNTPRAPNRSCELPCRIDGCNDLVHARGLCMRHYNQAKHRATHGRPGPGYDAWAGLKREGGTVQPFPSSLPPDMDEAAMLETLVGTPVANRVMSPEGTVG